MNTTGRTREGSALARLVAVQPALAQVSTGGAALGLRPLELLHAGPPLQDPRRPPPPLLSAAVVTCLHEGWADDADQVQSMLRDGSLSLAPAQERACVTPLAAIVSAGTPLFGIRDLAAGKPSVPASAPRESAGAGCIWSPVSTVRGPDTRVGSRDPAMSGRLARRDAVIAPVLGEAIVRRGPLPLWPIAAAGLAGGDDLHSRTSAATARLVSALREWLPGEVPDDLAATPLFFLTLWMGACRLVLRAGEGADMPTLVTRAGDNGERFAISLAGAPDRWSGTVATAPAGARLPAAPADAPICGAIGDSAVIDLLGFGGQRLALAPEPLGVLAGALPADHRQLAERLLCIAHPLLTPPWPIGLDARRVIETGCAPLIALAMIGADGRSGLLGRGVYRPPVSLFQQALDDLG